MAGSTCSRHMDALEEVQIKTSNYTADSFHADLYEIWGNDIVDALTFFDNSVAPFKQNIFGFTVGGPVYIPGHYSRTSA